MNKSIILVVILVLIAVSTMFLLFKCKCKSKCKSKCKLLEKFQTNCSFTPYGITRQECLDACNMERNGGDEGCDKGACENICDSCTKSECQWKQDVNGMSVGSRTPLAPRIKGYSGDRQIKIAWVEPKSRLPITKYILVVECEDQVPKLYYPSASSKLLEYSVFNLENEKEYRLSLFAENEAGLSVISNTATVKPQKNMKTPVLTSDTDIEKIAGVDSSLEKTKRSIFTEIDEKMLDKIGYNPEKKDYYDIIKLLDQTKPIVDLGDGNVKIRFV